MKKTSLGTLLLEAPLSDINGRQQFIVGIVLIIDLSYWAFDLFLKTFYL